MSRRPEIDREIGFFFLKVYCSHKKGLFAFSYTKEGQQKKGPKKVAKVSTLSCLFFANWTYFAGTQWNMKAILMLTFPLSSWRNFNLFWVHKPWNIGCLGNSDPESWLYYVSTLFYIQKNIIKLELFYLQTN